MENLYNLVLYSRNEDLPNLVARAVGHRIKVECLTLKLGEPVSIPDNCTTERIIGYLAEEQIPGELKKLEGEYIFDA